MVKFTALNKKNHFFRLKKEKNCFTEKGLKVYIEEKEEKHSKLGISISSKQTTAVERNKFKRRIKEAVRGLEEYKNFDIYIIGSKQNLNLKVFEIQKIISSHPKLIKKWRSEIFYLQWLDRCWVCLVLVKEIAYIFLHVQT